MRRFAVCLLGALLLPFPAFTGQQDQPPVVRVTTRLVQVNVIVHDKQGHPVTGLSKDDFQIFDNGKPQQVRFFSMETNRVDAAPAEPLPADTYTNRMEQRGGVPTALTAVLFDGLNSRIQDQMYARQQIMKFLQQLQPNDRVAIYALGSRLRVLHDFTSDMNALLKVIAGRTHLGGELDASQIEEPDTGNSQMDDFLREASERQAAFYTTRRVEATAQALEAIAEHLSGRTGRKNLIWVSGGFPIQFGMNSDRLSPEQRTYSAEIERATRAVNQANVAIYPVDARGLMGMFDTMPAMAPSSAPMRGRAATNVNNRASQAIFDTQATMHELADRTGGRAFINTNDIAGAIRRAVDDSQVTYNLAYAPDHDQWNGKFREIKVKVDRSGLDVRFRKGYVASAAPVTDDQKERLAEVNLAAGSPLEATGLGLLVKKTASTPHLGFQLQLDPHEMDFQQKEGRWAAGVDVVVALRSKEGAVLQTYSRTAGFNLKPESYTTLLGTGINLSMQCDSAPGATKARIIVRDVTNGQIGSVDIPLY